MAKNLMYEPLPGAGAKFEHKMFAPEGKDTKDLARNLVWAPGTMDSEEKRGCKGVLLGLLALVLAGLVGWLVAVTVLGYAEVDKLKREVLELRSEMMFLKQRLDADMFDGVKDFEAVFADLDNKNWPRKKGSGEGGRADSKTDLDMLKGVTVLEDVDDADVMDGYDDEDDDEDGDDEDGDDGESGWHGDYDDTNERPVGYNSMVKLSDADFLGTVLKTPEEHNKRLSKLGELRKMLKDEPSSMKASLGEKERAKRSLPDDMVDAFAAPRQLTRNPDDRKKLKKYLVEVENKSQKDPKTFKKPSLRTVRNSDDEEGSSSRPFIAAHFHGNTTHLNPDIHEHYKGNGLVRVAHETAHDVWWPAAWTQRAPAPRPTLTRAGHVHVHHSGIYLVYVQIYYWDAHDTAGWVLHRNSFSSGERDTLLQCAVTAPSVERREKTNSCFSAAALHLRQGDRLAVRNTGGDRHSLMLPEKSFFGLVKLADAEDSNEEF